MQVAFAGVLPIVFESNFGHAEAYWGGAWLAYVLVLTTMSLVMRLPGLRKSAAEVEAGYTVFNSIYVKNPDLFLLAAKTLEAAANPTVPWKSLAVARTVAGLRGEKTYLPDNSWKAIRLNQTRVREIMRDPSRRRDHL
jgi:hypothetical protein